MDERINELNKQIESIKKEEKINEILKNLKKAKRMNNGKCYSNHTLARHRKNASNIDISISRILDYGLFFNTYDMNENTRISENDLSNLSLDDLGKVITAIKIESCKYFKMEGSSNTISASYNVSYQNSTAFFPGFKYEISKEEFERVMNVLKCRAEEFGQDLKKNIPNYEVVFYGNYEYDKVKWLEEHGHKIKRLPSESAAYHLSRCPFVFGDKIVINEDSKNYVKECIEKECRKMGIGWEYKHVNSIADRNMEIFRSVLELWDQED